VGAAATIYTVQVTGGTANPTSGTTGTVVTLTAGTAPQGKQYKQWSVVSGGVTITGNTFTIGTADVVIEAVWEDVSQPTTYTVTVTGGTGSGDYETGATVAIVAIIPDGQQFKNWTTASPGVAIANVNSASTTFVMPANPVTVTANFEGITGNAEPSPSHLKIYPNPFADVVHITHAEGCTLRVVNTAGVVVHTQPITSPDETLRLGRLPNGIHFFRIEKNNRMITVKVVKR
jgi:hypothetical protein